MRYHSHYSDTTALAYAAIPSHRDISARQGLMRQRGLVCTGEAWIKGYGLTAVYELTGAGAELSEAELSVFCLKKCPDSF